MHLIRSLWSLEAAAANASDVFILWLAIIAALACMFEVTALDRNGIPRDMANAVTEIIKADMKSSSLTKSTLLRSLQILVGASQTDAS